MTCHHRPQLAFLIATSLLACGDRGASPGGLDGGASPIVPVPEGGTPPAPGPTTGPGLDPDAGTAGPEPLRPAGEPRAELVVPTLELATVRELPAARVFAPASPLHAIVAPDGQVTTLVSAAAAGDVPAGYQLWRFSAGLELLSRHALPPPTGSDYAFSVNSLANNDAGAFYVAGQIRTLEHVRNRHDGDAFVAKYAPSGERIWDHQETIQRRNQNTQANWIALGPDGATYVIGSANLALAGQSMSGDFLRSYDDTGNLRWTRQPITLSPNAVRGMAIDPRGELVVAFANAAFRLTTAATALPAVIFPPGAPAVDRGVHHARGLYAIGRLPGPGRGGRDMPIPDTYLDWALFAVGPTGPAWWRGSVSQSSRVSPPTGINQLSAVAATDDAIFIAGNYFVRATPPAQEKRPCFVARLDLDGTLVWSTEFMVPGTTLCQPVRLAARSGGVLVMGHTGGTAPVAAPTRWYLAKLAPDSGAWL